MQFLSLGGDCLKYKPETRIFVGGNMVQVQVLVPCYNYARFLEQNVQSVLSQEGVDVDVLIIDDCSTDNTPQVCGELASRDARVRIIRHETNKGHIATYNDGIANIRGDYFVLLSADDLLTPGALLRAVSVMEANPNVGMTYGQAISFRDELPRARTSATGASIWDGRKWMRQVCRSGKNFVICPEVVVRASIQRRIGGYDPLLPHSGDMEMWLRIASISDVGRVQGADQAYYRLHPLSMQRTVHAGFLFDLIARDKAFRFAFEKEGASLPERDELYSLARRALAMMAIYHARELCDLPKENDASPREYRDLAIEFWPDIVKTSRCRAVDAIERGEFPPGSVKRDISHRVAQLRKFVQAEVFDRIEYHWARRTGTYFPR